LENTLKKSIVLGTKNQDKVAELSHLLKGSGIHVLSLNNFPGQKDMRETGTTFAANARQKARFYSKRTGLLTLADDSGLMVSALNGKPGVYSARFAGPGCTYTDNCKKLLRLLAAKKGTARRAKFVSVIAIYDKGKFADVVRGECAGMIAEEAKGKNGFGYDAVFIPDGSKKTFAEMSPAEKNKVSHRGKALRGAVKILRNYPVTA
jgi:XTP/dITP diphosphohydrolase